MIKSGRDFRLIKTVICFLNILGLSVFAEQPIPDNNNVNVNQFITSEGKIDLDDTCLSGFAGSLDISGFEVSFNSLTNEPILKSIGTNSDPDDIYWTEGLSPITGVVSNIFAMAVYNGQFIIGGELTAAGDTTVDNIAAWNGSSWTPLGVGLNGPVKALTVFENQLIAGGQFNNAGGVGADYIASWDGSSWAKVGTGMNSHVYTLTVYNDKLIAGGSFALAGGTMAK